MIKEFDYLYKTVIIGNSGVGKSAILIRFVENSFEDNYLATIGVDFRFKTMIIGNHKVKFQIWDTAGQERFRTITSAYYRGSQAILLVFDLTDQSSFENIVNFWMGEVQNYAEKESLFALVGNKCDLPEARAVPIEKVRAFCDEKKLLYFECSAKEDQKVKDIFSQLAKTLIERQKSKEAKPKKAAGESIRKTQSAPKEKKGCC